MLLQIVSNALVQKVDSLRVLTENVMNAQQTQSVEIESIRDSVQTLANQYALHNDQMEAITAQLNNIPAFGLKYGDTAAHIAIPLIIALFAFAFPYMFSVITRINQKYDSESILRMFKGSGSYRSYMWGSGISVFYILVFGLITLIPYLSRLQWLMVGMSWISVIVAGVYAGIILRFVRTCLEYDDHYALLSVIGFRYERNIKKPQSLNTCYSRLLELCKYAVRAKKDGLLSRVLSEVNKFDKTEKEKTGRPYIATTLSFYENVVDSFVQTPKGWGMERILYQNWQQTFRHDELPSPIVFSLMLSRIVNVVKQGRYSVFEAYVEQCRNGYDFINRVPAVKYIVGQDTTVQKEIDDQRLYVWSSLRETHFFVASYLFSIGYYEVAVSLKESVGYFFNAVYPSTLPSILKLYVDCKEKQDGMGEYIYSYWLPIDETGNKYDWDVLEKYTSMALLLAGIPDDEEEYIIGEKKMDLLHNVKNELIEDGKLWLNHPEILRRFPQIRGVKIDEQIKEGMSRLSTGITPLQKKSGKIISPPTNIFKQVVSEQQEALARDSIISVLDTNLADGLDGILNENKNEAIALGAYAFLVDKPHILTPEVFRDSEVFDEMNQVFQRRCLYVLYEAISQMIIKDVTTTWDHFERLFLKYVGDSGEQFVIIDSGCSMKGHLDMDKLDDGKIWTTRKQYKGAYYYDESSRMPSDLRKDLPLLNSFDETIIVISFADLPSLVSTSDNNAPTVSFSDESNEALGRAAVRVTVDPCLEARYCKDAEVLRIRIKP